MGSQTIDKKKLIKVLKETFGYDSFRFEQEKIITSVLAGQDTLAIMPTGGGKSLCYQLPALCLDGLTLVVSPLIALMQDQVKSLQQNGVSAAFWNSSVDGLEKNIIRDDLRNQKLKLLYVAPEGIVSGSVLSALGEHKPSLIAIDEAHCVSQWGHEFRQDYRELSVLKEHFPNTPTIALTATADARTRESIGEELALRDARVFVSSFDRPNITYEICERRKEIEQLDAFIKQKHPEDTGIVYCLSRKKVESVCEKLLALGHNAVAYHAGMTSVQRSRHQKRFDLEDRIVMVATVAFGMGIDRPDVRFVAHLDLPKSIEGYYQETGRAGRDGAPSSAWMVYGFSDVVKLSQMIESSDATDSYKRIARHKLDQMLALCETTQCRRQRLLSYFAEELPEPCGNCDVCLSPPETWEATVEGQKFLSAVYRTGQNFGASYVIDVLRGAQTQKIQARQHQKLSVFGIGKDLSPAQWNSLARQLLVQGFLSINNWEYKTLALGPKSRGLLRGESALMLKKLSPKKKASQTKFRKGAGAESSSSTLSDEDLSSHGRDELFDELKKLRRSLSQEQGVPPYVVFSDRSLHDMCQLLPKSESDFLLVFGVGQSKLDRYGRVFLETIAQHS